MASVTVARSKLGRTSKIKTAGSKSAAGNGEEDESRSPDAGSRPSLKRKRAAEPVRELEVDISAPEPLSKKALRKSKRQAVGVPEKAGPEKAGPSASKENARDATDQEPPAKKSDHGVWIGNLSYLTTKLDLRTFLREKGQIADDEITRIHLPTLNATKARPGTSNTHKAAAQSKGFAYVDFTAAEALERALALSETLLSGRKLLIKNAKSFEGRPEPAKADDSSTSKQSPSRANKKVFLGNLAFDTSTEDLTDLLSQCGPLKKLHMATFEDSGKCKGYAWAEFETLEAAEAAVRGWIKVSVDDEVGSDEEAHDGSGSDEHGHPVPQRRVKKTRKRWVNRIKGRTLRAEFAEDDATRYKKRFGTREASRPKRHAPSESNGADGTKRSGDGAGTDGGARRERVFGRGVTRASAKRAREEWLQDLEKLEAEEADPALTQKPSLQPQAVGTKIKFDE